MKVKVAQSCLTLCNPMGYTVHGILHARILEGVAFPFSGGCSWPRNWTMASCIESDSLISQLVKNPICNAGDPGSIPRLGRSHGEEIGYALQYSWASLVAQLIRDPPTIQKTWAQYLVWGDPLEKGKTTHSSILAWRISWTVVHGITKCWTRLSNFNCPLKDDLIQGVATPVVLIDLLKK